MTYAPDIPGRKIEEILSFPVPFLKRRLSSCISDQFLLDGDLKET